MGAAYLVSVSLYLVGLVIRDGYELLKKTGEIDAADTALGHPQFASEA